MIPAFGFGRVLGLGDELLDVHIQHDCDLPNQIQAHPLAPQLNVRDGCPRDIQARGKVFLGLLPSLAKQLNTLSNIPIEEISIKAHNEKLPVRTQRVRKRINQKRGFS
jgi:hypothetical protein